MGSISILKSNTGRRGRVRRLRVRAENSRVSGERRATGVRLKGSEEAPPSAGGGPKNPKSIPCYLHAKAPCAVRCRVVDSLRQLTQPAPNQSRRMVCLYAWRCRMVRCVHTPHSAMVAPQSGFAV